MQNFLFLTIICLIASARCQNNVATGLPTELPTTASPETTATITGLPETTVITTAAAKTTAITTAAAETTAITTAAAETTAITTAAAETTAITTAAAETTDITTTESLTTTVGPTDIVPTYEVAENNNICIRLQVLASLKIFYSIEGKDDGFAEFDLKTSTVTPSGKCGNETETIKLTWMPDGTQHLWNISVDFGQIDKQGINFLSADQTFYGVKQMSVEYVLEDKLFPGTNVTGRKVVQSEGMNFKAKTGAYYTCKSSQTIQLSSKNLPGANLLTRDLKVQAFHSGNEHNFTGDSTVCESDSTSSSVVPIAVGVTLAVLILIALITFIIGSRRRQANYETI